MTSLNLVVKRLFRPLVDRKEKYKQIDDGHLQSPATPVKWQENHRQPQSAQPIALLFISAVVFALSLLLNRFVRDYLPIERACTARFSPWAPMIEAVSYEWTQYDSVNLDPDYAGPPTWERESRWPEQYDHGFVTYPYNKISLLNKSTNDDWWVHDGDLIALPEWAHQVHCIWLIRQWLYRDAFDYSPFTNISAARFHMHKDHCFLVLKTMVECKADATPILFAKDDSNLGAWRTVDPPKLCRRNERLVQYVKENMVCDLECEPRDLED